MIKKALAILCTLALCLCAVPTFAAEADAVIEDFTNTDSSKTLTTWSILTTYSSGAMNNLGLTGKIETDSTTSNKYMELSWNDGTDSNVIYSKPDVFSQADLAVKNAYVSFDFKVNKPTIMLFVSWAAKTLYMQNGGIYTHQEGGNGFEYEIGEWYTFFIKNVPGNNDYVGIKDADGNVLVENNVTFTSTNKYIAQFGTSTAGSIAIDNVKYWTGVPGADVEETGTITPAVPTVETFENNETDTMLNKSSATSNKTLTNAVDENTGNHYLQASWTVAGKHFMSVQPNAEEYSTKNIDLSFKFRLNDTANLSFYFNTPLAIRVDESKFADITYNSNAWYTLEYKSRPDTSTSGNALITVNIKDSSNQVLVTTNTSQPIATITSNDGYRPFYFYSYGAATLGIDDVTYLMTSANTSYDVDTDEWKLNADVVNEDGNSVIVLDSYCSTAKELPCIIAAFGEGDALEFASVKTLKAGKKLTFASPISLVGKKVRIITLKSLTTLVPEFEKIEIQ